MSKKKRNTSTQTNLCIRFTESLSLLGLKPSTIYRALGYNTPSTVYSIIAGKCLPDLTRLIELSKIRSPGGYRINIDWLITGTGPKVLKKERAGLKRKNLEKLLAVSSQAELDAMVILLGK